jgi:hypothetical protein
VGCRKEAGGAKRINATDVFLDMSGARHARRIGPGRGSTTVYRARRRLARKSSDIKHERGTASLDASAQRRWTCERGSVGRVNGVAEQGWPAPLSTGGAALRADERCLWTRLR